MLGIHPMCNQLGVPSRFLDRSDRGLLLVLSGPSGAGKTTVARRVLDQHSGLEGCLEHSVSVTTRPPRPGEVDGSDYFFIDDSRFADLAARGELLEKANLLGHWYATPRTFVEDRLSKGIDMLLILDGEGRRQLELTHAADLVSVFLLPPTIDELKRRMSSRAQDGQETIGRRLEAAKQDIAGAGDYQHVLVNYDLDQTVKAVAAILQAARRRRRSQQAM